MSMSPAASAVGKIISAAEVSQPREDEYMGEDGLLRCSVCGGPRQVKTPAIEGLFLPRVVRCICSCGDKERNRWKEQERREEIERRRRTCFRGTGMETWNFKNDDGRRPELAAAAMKYAEQFQQYRKDGKGLLYYGPVGTGKTYLAACIANAVIDQGYTARMTNFADISDELWDTKEKAEYIESLRRYDLLIIDDLGTERQNEYMQEIVYKVIDARYRSGGAMVFTTNLTDKELAQTSDIGHSRIYDRILERCLAIKVDGQSRRRQAVKTSWEEMRHQLEMEV